MRRFLLGIIVASCVLIVAGIAVAVALSIGWSGDPHPLTITIDGERVDGLAVAALFGAAGALGVAFGCIAIAVVVASLAIAVPLVLAVSGVVMVVAAVVGLSPLLVPVLLVVGAYVLLSRRRRSPATARVS